MTDPAATNSHRYALLPPEVRALAVLGVERHYRTGALLIQEGDDGDTLFIVLTGRLRAFVSDRHGKEATLAYHGPGDYVGEMSLDGGLRSANVEAVEPARCVVVTRANVLRHVSDAPEFAHALIGRLIKRARLATQSARNLALLDVYGRLKALLEDQAGPSRGARLTHRAIASEIGCSREMVSRLMRDLVDGGYVRTDARRIEVQRPLPDRW